MYLALSLSTSEHQASMATAATPVRGPIIQANGMPYFTRKDSKVSPPVLTNALLSYRSPSTHCVTMSVYESFHMVAPSVTYIQCRKNWPVLTLHRHLAIPQTTSTGIASQPRNERLTAAHPFQFPDTTIPTSPGETTNSSLLQTSPGGIPATPITPTRTQIATPSPGDFSEKFPDEKKVEAAKISSIIIGTILFIAIVILGLLLGRSKWNKSVSQTSLRKLHEAEGSTGLVSVPIRRRVPRHGSQRSHTSRDGFIAFDDLSPSERYAPAQELPTVVEERYHQVSTASSPISPCVSSPR
ncbi:hypothetical protein BDDG_02131 [Blastomyces dermatitidis ATCC 18188]|uniref:Uncharacterized protein n=1 Tax=Ajellomyces dermatitidis (strain ATCC 18188 / CBS 674.68) TaxID=653446 RepID=F2T7I0_AJEDA|nr:hypothetical protein BDDG_02131 [Blastomyces dermatitidis ATCC 18188]